MATYRPLVLISGVFAQLPQNSEIVTSGNSTSTGGSVQTVQTGVGLTGGPITVSGAVNLEDTAVTPGTYTLSTITVDQQGRITNASTGNPPGASGTVEVVDTGTGLTGGPITESGVIALADTAVTAGNYKATNLSVNAQGQITAASDAVIDDLSDVVITAVQTGQLLQFNGSEWANVDAGTVGGVTSVNGMTGAVLSSNGIDVPSLSGVQISSPINDQVLSWDTDKWINKTLPAATVPGDGESNVDVQPSTGLSFTGANATANQTGDTTRTIAGVDANSTTKGVMKLIDAVDSTDTTSAASANSVKDAYDHVEEYAPSKDGTDATGTWGINITGNADTATDATNSEAVLTEEKSDNVNYRLPLVPAASGNQTPATNQNIFFNPASGTLFLAKITSDVFNLSALPPLPSGV